MVKKILSLFSGSGGMDLGFEGDFKVPSECVNKNIHSDWINEESEGFIKLKKNNFKHIFANDIEQSAYVAWTSYFCNKKGIENVFHTKSIVELVNSYYNGDYDFPNKVQIVTGGFPCQDFSVSGKRLGFNSHKSHENKCYKSNMCNKTNRGNLYIWMKKVIEITQPYIFIAENVKGLITLKNAKDRIEQDFNQINDYGFIVIPKVINAANYGIPQNRERIFFIGLNKDYLKKKAFKHINKPIIPEEYDPFPKPTHFNDKNNNNLINILNKNNKLVPYVKCSEALKGLNEPRHEANDLAQINYSKAKYGGQTQGQIEIDLNHIAPTIRAEHHGNIEYRRLSIVHGGQHKHELNQGLIERRLTVRECARLQTYPDDYDFVIKGNGSRYKLSPSSSYKLIGNSVPPLLAYSIAKKLEEIWENLFIT